MIFDNMNFMYNTEENFLSCVREGKKIVLFGAGAEMTKTMNRIIQANQLNVAYVVDNDYRKWYSRCFGIEVKEPKCLLEESIENTVVLITSVYPYRIEKQLHSLGIRYYYSSLLFIEEQIGKQQFMVTF